MALVKTEYSGHGRRQPIPKTAFFILLGLWLGGVTLPSEATGALVIKPFGMHLLEVVKGQSGCFLFCSLSCAKLHQEHHVVAKPLATHVDYIDYTYEVVTKD